MIDWHALIFFDDVTTIISRDKLLWTYLYFYKPYNNQIWQISRPASTDLTLLLWWRHQNYVTWPTFMTLFPLLWTL